MRLPLALYAYPRGSRRNEVLDTLLMAADAGRRPSVRLMLNLLRHGLRARLGRPRSRSVVVLAALVALVAGFFTAALANRLAWETAPDMPSPATRAELAQMITPGLPVTWEYWTPDDPSKADAPFAKVAGELDARRFYGSVDGTPETRRVAAYVAGLRERLSAAGWQVISAHLTDIDTVTGVADSDSMAVVARNDRLVLEFEDTNSEIEPHNRVSMTVYRTEPSWVTAATLAAGPFGAVAGWLIFAWASRRTEPRPVVSAFAALAGIVGLLLATPAVLLGVDYPVMAPFNEYLSDSAFWVGLEPTNEFGGLAIPAESMLATALLIAAACRRVRRVDQPATG